MMLYIVGNGCYSRLFIREEKMMFIHLRYGLQVTNEVLLLPDGFVTVRDVLEKLPVKNVTLHDENTRLLRPTDLVQKGRVYTVRRHPAGIRR